MYNQIKACLVNCSEISHKFLGMYFAVRGFMGPYLEWTNLATNSAIQDIMCSPIFPEILAEGLEIYETVGQNLIRQSNCK